MANIPVLSDTTYQLESELGSGSGGVVYKAWHTRLQKHVVIKELKKGSLKDIDTQRNEVEALKHVKSAYLPQVYDFLNEEDRIYTVMEFIEGESLDKLLDRGEVLSQQQVIKWYDQLTTALEEIHKNNVYHRDVKPANIMLTPGGDVCLIDFNAALVTGNDVSIISRSLGYASPEQYEIFERHKNALESTGNTNETRNNRAPIENQQHAPESDNTEVTEDTDKTAIIESAYNIAITEGTSQTEVTGVDKTEMLSEEEQRAWVQSESTDSAKPNTQVDDVTDEIDWKRSDIYSLGATMYHLLTGIRPPEHVVEAVTLSRAGRFGEGLVFVNEKSMQPDPARRFASSTELSEAISNIHKHDKRWRVAQTKKIAAAVIFAVAFAIFTSLMIFGIIVMAQEREERFFSYVREIGTGNDPKAAFTSAVEVFRDRIDPYRAMANRLWNDGDIDACREFIEQNLGSIAVFQDDPASAGSFGDIYYILGNCYFQSEEPNYTMAASLFEIALQYVTDNPSYYLVYAVSLARTGDIASAELVLERAREFNLEADSLHLLEGEIFFAGREYELAIESFNIVIEQSTDDHLRYLAYHTSDTIFKLLGQPERSIELLADSLNRIPLNRVPEMTERLADAYIRIGDFANAITLFEQLAATGVPRFHILDGLALMYQNVGKLDSAGEVLEQMSDMFPDYYRVPMRMAYLEAYIQSTLDIDNRDYTLTLMHFNEAMRLFNANTRSGETDSELQQLETIIEQLRAQGWID